MNKLIKIISITGVACGILSSICGALGQCVNLVAVCQDKSSAD